MNLLLASKICPEALEKLRIDHDVVCAWHADQDDLKRLVKGCDVIVFRSGVQISAELMEAAPRLKLLIRAGSGLDNLDMVYVKSKGLSLQRIPEPGSRAVAELAFGLMLALARQILKADDGFRNGRWLKPEIEGFVLRNKVLGVVGAGNIGRTVSEMGVSWGMRVMACVEHPGEERARRFGAVGVELTTFENVLKSADFLSLHVPLNQATNHMIGQAELAMLKQGAYLVNLARGGVVDEIALYKALIGKNGLAGAAMDVHESEGEGCTSALSELPNVVLTPHIGATTVDTQREIGQRIISIIDTMKKGYCQPSGITPWRCNDDQQIQTA